MLGKNYLIAASETTENWCARYNLVPETSTCLHCNQEIKTTIPAFSKNWRGLVAPQCSCGEITNLKKFVLTDDTEENCLISVLV